MMVKLRKGSWKIVSDKGFVAKDIHFDDLVLNENFERVRSASQTQVYRFFQDDKCYYLKTYTELSIVKSFRDLFRGLWSERACRVHKKLSLAGIKVPQIVCLARSGMCGVAISEESPGEIFIDVFKTMPADQRGELMSSFGRSVGAMHSKGFSHGDLRWGNVIVQGSGSQTDFVYLDNERTMAFRRIPYFHRKRNLVQVRLSGILNGMLESEWDLFFDSYCSVCAVRKAIACRWDFAVKNKAQHRAVTRKKRKERLLIHS